MGDLRRVKMRKKGVKLSLLTEKTTRQAISKLQNPKKEASSWKKQEAICKRQEAGSNMQEQNVEAQPNLKSINTSVKM